MWSSNTKTKPRQFGPAFLFRKRSYAFFVLIIMTCLDPHNACAEGDQFLDGIGETALIARYVFDGDLKDWSRNSLHATMKNGDAVFVDDDQFGKVLALPGGSNGTAVQIPGQSLASAESLSIAGWIKMESLASGQIWFDLASDKSHRFVCTPTDRDGELSAIIVAGNKNARLKAFSMKDRKGRWTHLALVLNTANKTLSLYINGHLELNVKDVDMGASNVIDLSNPRRNQLLIGGGVDKAPAFAGRLHDFRVYRTALNDRQIAVIHHNGISEDKWGAEKIEESVQNVSPARQLMDGLEGVEDVAVETTVGHLPHLPVNIPGIYSNGEAGPSIRVIWPAPRDNRMVQQAGTYTVTGHVPGTDFTPVATVIVKKKAASRPPLGQVLQPFPLGQVTLNPDANGTATPFMQHRDKFIKGLAKSNPDTFLFNFRDAFGQPQPENTEPLYVWDSQTCRLRGHASGHYLTAIAQACASTTYDEELHQLFAGKMDYMIDVLYELSQMSGKPKKGERGHTADPADVPPGPGREGYDSNLSKEGIRTDYWNWGEGFISGYPPDQFILLEQGASYGTGNDQVWAPYYTLHKILAGLMDCYEVGGNPKALEVAKGMGLWVYTRLKEVPDETRIRMWNSYIAGEYGGMNEAMARLHQLTGDKRFLECAKLFDNTSLFFGDAEHVHGLACNVDTLRGKHANQHIPQITGALETYKGTHDAAYYRVAENFWERCTHSYMYSIGGVAGAKNPNNAECFTAEPDTLFENGLSEQGQNETCATYNLLKLGRQLFMFDPEPGYMDYYERALYNHILASVAEHDAGNTYHVPLNPGAVKSFGNAEMNGFTCCNGTALESATKLQNTIYMKSADDSTLYVNLYIPSTLDWQERDIKITQSTSYPYSEFVTLTIEGSGEFGINLRIPDWVDEGTKIILNGVEEKTAIKSGSYLELKRKWNSGDTILLKLSMDFHLMPLMDQPNIASVFYGPILLAAEETEARSSWRTLELDPENIGGTVKGDPSTLRFDAGAVRFKPFFETYGRHSVYLDIVPKKNDQKPGITSIDPPEHGFFAKLIDFEGIPIKASSAVEDRALHLARDRLSSMLRNLPEWRHDKGKPLAEYNGLTRDERTRGMGGLMTSCGEENLLRLPEDRYRGTDICVHEFAHNVMDNGAPADVGERFEVQRNRSLEKGLWVGSYAGSNAKEFFAELAMWYFGTRGNLFMEGPKPKPGPEGLKAYDPEAYALVDAFWSGRL